MSYSHSSPDEFADARDLDDLRSEVSRLEEDLRERIRSLDRQYADLFDNVEGLGAEVRNGTAEVREVRAELEQFQRRVQRQTAWFLKTSTIRRGTVAELDEVSGEISEWAIALRRGNAASTQLLSDAMRKAHEGSIARYRAWISKGRDLDDRLITSVRATTDRDLAAEEDWSAYEESHTSSSQHHQTGRYLQQGAETATAALQADDTLRASLQPVLHAHETASHNLTKLILDRLEAMLNKSQTPPLWFVQVLGAQPVRDGEWDDDEPNWIRTTVMLVTYRITYGVTDPLEALGRPLHPSPVQEQQRQDTERAVARYR
ncbi:hypothetical protein ACFV9C_41650 [Kribbella sp. NPDC059898]|uniref:hypothetical protein n=1 Tax=Kribbella sp. NPDC059898 TaxID=3346995 RepID=UPI003651FACE